MGFFLQCSGGGAAEAVWQALACGKQAPKGGMDWETTRNRTDCLQETTKQQQTTATSSESLEPLPQWQQRHHIDDGICKQLHMHNGIIEVISVFDKGTNIGI